MEEMLFRGYIQTGLAGRLGPARGVLAASILFGAAHMDAVQGPMAVLLGLYLGFVTEWTGSIRPAIACHVVNNLFGTLAPAVLPFAPSPAAHAISLAVSAAGLAIGIPWIRRRLPQRAGGEGRFEGSPGAD
jgi:membrane protease YdiL (CAAX protease family)